METQQHESIGSYLRRQGEHRPYLVVVEEILKRKVPGLLDLVYPRQYDIPGNYSSPKLVGLALAEIMHNLQGKELSTMPHAYCNIYLGMEELLKHRMPLFFPTKPLLEAITHTDHDQDISWIDMKLPYESAIFVLPRNTLRHPVDGEVAFIMYTRNYRGLHKAPLPGNYQSVELDADCFSIIAALPYNDDLLYYDCRLTSKFRPTVKMHDLFYGEQPEVPLHNAADAPLEAIDKPFIDSIGSLTFGLLLAMTIRPDLLTEPKLLCTVKHKATGRRREFWSPNYIGERYVLRQHIQATGTHATPQPHFRRGHFRSQAYGPAYSQHKTLWIEPTFVAG